MNNGARNDGCAWYRTAAGKLNQSKFRASAMRSRFTSWILPSSRNSQASRWKSSENLKTLSTPLRKTSARLRFDLSFTFSFFNFSKINLDNVLTIVTALSRRPRPWKKKEEEDFLAVKQHKKTEDEAKRLADIEKIREAQVHNLHL